MQVHTVRVRQYGAVGLSELVKLVGAEVISEAEAARRATTADWEWDDDQILGLVEFVAGARRRGDLKPARIVASLLLTVVEQVRPEMWRIAALAFVRVATEVATEELDGAVYRQGCAAAARLLPGADGDTLLAIAHLKLEPFAVDPIRGTYPERKRARRARLERRSFDWSDEVDLPQPEQALGEAQAHFAALANLLTGFGRGVALIHQAYAVFSFAEAGGQVEQEEYLALCVEAWRLLDNEPLGTARACWMLARRDALDRVPGHPLVLPPTARLMDAYGPRIAAVISAIGLRLFGPMDRAFSLGLCEQVVAALPVRGFESRRAWFSTFPAHILPNDPTDCATAAAVGSVPALTMTGRAAGWTEAQVTDAVLHALAHDTTGGEADLGEVAPNRAALVKQLHTDRLERVGRTLMSTDDYATAVVKLILAAGLHAQNNNPDAAETCLHLAAVCVTESHDAACVAVTELVKRSDLLVAYLGQPAVSALDELYRAGFFHLFGQGRQVPIVALMQLKKGRAFARSQAAPGPLTPRTDGETEALAEADAARTLLLPQADMTSAESDELLHIAPSLFDGDAFLGAFLLDAEIQPGRSPVEELANRRRACQRLDAVRLTCEAGPTPVFEDHDVREKLPRDAVLVSIYEGGVLTPPRPGIVYMFVTAEATWSITVRYQESQSRNQLEMSIAVRDGGFTRRIRYTPGAHHTAHVRRLLLEDPLSRCVSREAAEALAEEALGFEALLDQLASLHEVGKRQLVIWPHGVYYFFPFHLLPTGNGRMVADDWTVVSVPSLQSVVGVPRRVRRESVLAMASPNGGVRHGLPAEPDVTQQAQAVAAAFGTEPLLDTIATTERFLADAGQARFIHLAAHGAQYPPAPLFDAIYLADNPLYAHQVLQLDLRGVELVTLSACESALLRFDLSDNLHGMAAAFLRAGAGAVVGASWPVRAAVAGTFFAELYGCLARGQRKIAAFREAQLVTRQKYPQYRDWAAFSMIGDCWER